MRVPKLGDVELQYTSLESLDYEPGGQLYGTMEGTLSGDRVAGTSGSQIWLRGAPTTPTCRPHAGRAVSDQAEIERTVERRLDHARVGQMRREDALEGLIE